MLSRDGVKPRGGHAAIRRVNPWLRFFRGFAGFAVKVWVSQSLSLRMSGNFLTQEFPFPRLFGREAGGPSWRRFMAAKFQPGLQVKL